MDRKNFYSIVIIYLTIFIPAPLLMAQTKTLNEHQKSARDIFQELIEINTTLKMGSTKAVNAMAARLENAGFDKSDIHIVGPMPEHMNLVVRFRGKNSSHPILFIAHLDVVEALREDWSFDPFKFQEIDGYFYGRGTTDVKCEDADLVANLIRLKKEGFIPGCDLIIALTEHEENGDFNGIKWLTDYRRDLIDAEYCINLDGGGGEIKNGKHSVLELQTSEKVYLDFQFEVKNKGGHSSLPVKENAIYRLAAALNRLGEFEFPVNLNETTRMFFERNAGIAEGQVKDDMIALLKVPVNQDAAARIANASPYYNSIMRTTCVATILEGGHAQNALPQSARANINCRMLPDDSQENVLATLRSVVADSLVSITCTHASVQGPLSPVRKDVLDHLDRISASMWPGVLVTPVMSTGATDGKYLRLAGIPVYGISGMFYDMDDVRAHGRDERIGVNEFYQGVEFMYQFMKALSTNPK
jgi:acetylornithine deacetylase/succinyl-diaminopimelate desuccinylase-like protein